jgi:hypothetical protein
MVSDREPKFFSIPLKKSCLDSLLLQWTASSYNNIHRFPGKAMREAKLETSNSLTQHIIGKFVS